MLRREPAARGWSDGVAAATVRTPHRRGALTPWDGSHPNSTVREFTARRRVGSAAVARPSAAFIGSRPVWQRGIVAMTVSTRHPGGVRAALKRARAGPPSRPGFRTDLATPVRVAIADDAYLIREALAGVLSHIEGVELVASCAAGDELLAAVETAQPHVVMVDIRMPPTGDEEGIRVANQLRQDHPEIGVIVLSQFSGPAYALAVLEDGAEGRGYLLKERLHDANELHAAINIVAEGGTTIDPTLVRELLATDVAPQRTPLDELSPREREVLAQMAEGKSNAAIAESLVLTKRAVEKHVGQIFQKLGLEDDEVVSRRVTAVLLYLASAAELVGAYS
jgi:DNA-binding NarL/FixJ family response regulator